jgi:5-methylcytosine-specific restriction endonuclease McrA
MTERTLVLNVTNLPLTVVSVERALTLMLKDKVDVVASNGRVFHSAGQEFRAPSVVRIRYYVHIPYKPGAPRVSRKAVFARDNGECQYCGKKAENLDHVVPQAIGGKHSWDNLVAACRKCNSRKRDRTPEQANMHLKREPREPSGSKYYVFGTPDPEWEPYLG